MGVLRRKFGSLYCPKTIKKAYGKKRRKVTKRRRKVTKRRRKKKSNTLSSIFNIINPSTITKVLNENPEIMNKIVDLRELKNSGQFSPKELVAIAAMSTLSDMSVQDASVQFSMMKGSGMSTNSIFDRAMGSSAVTFQPPPVKKSFLQRMTGMYGKVKRKRKVKKKIPASLKKLCKKHKVRLTIKRGKRRVYKSEKVLKKQCKTAMKKKK